MFRIRLTLSRSHNFDFISYFLILSLFCQFLNKVVSVGVFPIHEGPIFFSQVIIIMEMRLKFQITRHLEYQNMSQLIPHCSKSGKNWFSQKAPSQKFWNKAYFFIDIYWSWNPLSNLSDHFFSANSTLGALWVLIKHRSETNPSLPIEVSILFKGTNLFQLMFLGIEQSLASIYTFTNIFLNIED